MDRDVLAAQAASTRKNVARGYEEAQQAVDEMLERVRAAKKAVREASEAPTEEMRMTGRKRAIRELSVGVGEVGF